MQRPKRSLLSVWSAAGKRRRLQYITRLWNVCRCRRQRTRPARLHKLPQHTDGSTAKNYKTDEKIGNEFKKDSFPIIFSFRTKAGDPGTALPNYPPETHPIVTTVCTVDLLTPKRRAAARTVPPVSMTYSASALARVSISGFTFYQLHTHSLQNNYMPKSAEK